jgi:hypothetical protein
MFTERNIPGLNAPTTEQWGQAPDRLEPETSRKANRQASRQRICADLLEAVGGLRLRKVGLRNDAIKELATGQQLHHQIQLVLAARRGV